MTPLEIEILLHYYCTRSDYRNGDFSAPAVRDAIDAFNGDLSLLCREETLQPERTYKVTERGEAYIKFLCALPLPVCVWMIPKEAS